jgi:hypothetical protein
MLIHGGLSFAILLPIVTGLCFETPLAMLLLDEKDYLARGQVDPAFVPANGSAHFDIVAAGPYLAAVAHRSRGAVSNGKLDQMSV